MAIVLSRGQKGIIVVSTFWIVLSFLAAAGIADGSYGGFNLLGFLIALIIFSAPVWMYWAGVWIWGFGFLLRSLRTIKKYGTVILKKLLWLGIIVFVYGSVAVIFKGLEIDATAPNLLLLLLIIAAYQNRKKEWFGQGLEYGSSALIVDGERRYFIY